MSKEAAAQLLQVYSEAQLARLAALTDEVINRGHGEITITIKNRKPRFISMKLSEEFLYFDLVRESEIKGGHP